MDAGVLTVMESYTETDGVPNVANRETSSYLLRQRLGFEGVLVTDYEEIRNLFLWHHIVNDSDNAVIRALSQGTVDMSMIPWDADGFRRGALAAVGGFSIDMERITESARRVLKLKQHLRMFDEELTDTDPNLELVGTDDDVILEMARHSIILTKNNDSILPWKQEQGRKVLVTGPTSASLIYQTGGWSGQWQGAPNEQDWFRGGSSVLQGLAANPGEFDISFACGTNILGGECDDEVSKKGLLEEAEGWLGLGPHNSVDRAVKAAADVDLVVVCVGEEAYTEKPGDIHSLRLPDGQYELLRSLKNGSNAKILLVYFGGRPRLLGSMVEQSDAVLIGFLPGPSAGEAVADIIFGNVNPSGRLPITYPAFDDASGSPYFHTVSDQCTTGSGILPHYEYTSCDVQWPFGHGLSYTTFDYSDLAVAGDASGDLKVTFEVQNTGEIAGSEAILVFTFDAYRSTTPEYKRLRKFQKVGLASQESQTISLTLTQDDLAFVGPDDDSHYIMDPSKPFWIGIGASTDCRSTPDDPLCFRVDGSSTDFADPSCLAACSLWEVSGCASFLSLSQQTCLDMCTQADVQPFTYEAVGGKGWGWNYVNCLESVVWGMKNAQQPQCDLMTTLCRDVFRTRGLNEFGMGSFPSSQATYSVPPSTYWALLAGVIASTIIFFSLRGKVHITDEVGPHETVQFTQVTAANEDSDSH